MSATTTFAPSAASARAVAAPIPLAAPVTTATFPFRYPMRLASRHRGDQRAFVRVRRRVNAESAVDGDRDAGDEACLVGGQEHDRVGDVLGPAYSRGEMVASHHLEARWREGLLGSRRQGG